ncbi:hypothetical protein ACCO45_003258 [Purpureocillium lilacinum]|uniref:Uncharacterized protein n=1 Tax=Purpureocillium lilacinum TaxID=33203 RepID=A0ACC4DZD6_PURLI
MEGTRQVPPPRRQTGGAPYLPSLCSGTPESSLQTPYLRNLPSLACAMTALLLGEPPGPVRPSQAAPHLSFIGLRDKASSVHTPQHLLDARASSRHVTPV